MVWFNRWQIRIAVLVVIIGVWLVQFSQPLIIGADGLLHARLAETVLTRGLLRELPQAHFSWFAVRFSDKDFLYHLYLVPFVALGGLIAGTKLAAFFSTALLYLTVIYILKKLAARWTVLPFGLLLFLSSQWLRDTAEARPLIFAILLTLLGIYFINKAGKRAVLVISLIYGMLHLSAWVLPLYALIAGIYGWMTGGKFNKDTFIYSVSGYALSFLLHPNFPNNIFFTYLNGILVPWYAVLGGVLELGAEFFPLTTRDVLFRYPVIPSVLVFSGIAQFLVPVKTGRNTGFWMLASIIFGIYALFSVRNVTHLYPILIIFAALYASDFAAVLNMQRLQVRDRIKSVLVPVTAILFIAAGWQTITYINLMLNSDTVYSRHFENMANVIKSLIPPGSRIFHSNWSDSQYLIGFAPEYEYYVTLDPIYMYSYNKPLYEEYRNISFGRTKDPYTQLINDFGTYYGYAGKNYFTGLIDQIRRDDRFSIITEDSIGVLFRLLPEKAAEGKN